MGSVNGDFDDFDVEKILKKRVRNGKVCSIEQHCEILKLRSLHRIVFKPMVFLFNSLLVGNGWIIVLISIRGSPLKTCAVQNCCVNLKLPVFTKSSVCFFCWLFHFIFYNQTPFSIFLFIQGVTVKGNDIQYAIKYKNTAAITLVRSIEAIDKWPTELMDFLQSRIQFQSPVRSSKGTEVNQTAAVGKPCEILGKQF